MSTHQLVGLIAILCFIGGAAGVPAGRLNFIGLGLVFLALALLFV